MPFINFISGKCIYVNVFVNILTIIYCKLCMLKKKLERFCHLCKPVFPPDPSWVFCFVFVFIFFSSITHFCFEKSVALFSSFILIVLFQLFT